MGSRGGRSGGGESSLGYLFGSSYHHNTNNNSSSSNSTSNPKPPPQAPSELKPLQVQINEAERSQAKPPIPTENGPAAGSVAANNPNNYYRSDGQNTGNFITDRPTTKIHSAPGGGSSLGYLFGGGN